MSYSQQPSTQNEETRDLKYIHSGTALNSHNAPQWNPTVPFAPGAPNQYYSGPPDEQFLGSMPAQSSQTYRKFEGSSAGIPDSMMNAGYGFGYVYNAPHQTTSNHLQPLPPNYNTALPTEENASLQGSEASYGSFQPITYVQNASNAPFLGSNSPGPESPYTTSEYPPSSNRTSLLSSSHLSPVTSPGMSSPQRTTLMRTLSRGKATPSPKPGVRIAPYQVDNRHKRWSTGSYAGYQQQDPTFIPHSAPTAYPYGTAVSEVNSGTGYLPDNHGLMSQPTLQNQIHQPQAVMGIPPTSVLPSNGYATGYSDGQQSMHLQPPGFRTLESNVDNHDNSHHFSDLSGPPNLLQSLHDEQERPPPEDMEPDDPNMIPHEQELRFANDLYTPRWVRGQGNKREGWCGICKPGRWLVLKNSAFWYDKSFSHGISASTGAPFQEPTDMRRMDGSPNVWEGACGGCGEWIALVSGPRKGTTWFRHAYKCHSQLKIKDVQKKNKKNDVPQAQGSGMQHTLAPRGG